MARIDSFLAQLVAYEADALTLEAGDNLYLVKGDQRRALIQARPGMQLANQHVGALLSEIAPAQARLLIDRSCDVEFDYAFGNCTFHVEFAVVGGRFAARLRDMPKRAMDVTQESASSMAAPFGADGDAMGMGGAGAGMGGVGGMTGMGTAGGAGGVGGGALGALGALDDDPGDVDGLMLEPYFRAFFEINATDLHLTAVQPPMVRVDGEMVALAGFPPLDPYLLQKMLEQIIPPKAQKKLEERSDCDFSFEKGAARMRCSVFRDRNGIAGVFRRIAAPASVEQLGLSDAVVEMCNARRGLVLVTGPVRAGTSTTVAALVDHINETRADHVVTIEDPIEMVFKKKRASINQRQIGEHADDCASALRAAFREDADVVVIGCLRDGAAAALALELACTGHLVIAGMRAATASDALEQLLELAPRDKRDAVRGQLARSLRGVVAQALCRRSGGGGRVAAFEVLAASPSLARALRDGTDLAQHMASVERAPGTCTLNDALVDLVMQGKIEHAEALAHTGDRDALTEQLELAAPLIDGLGRASPPPPQQQQQQQRFARA